YFAAEANPELLVRAKPAYDGALSSGNGIAALNLAALAERTDEPRWRARLVSTLETFASAVRSFPLAHLTLVRAAVRGPRGAGAPRSLDALARDVVSAAGRLDPGDGPWRAFEVELSIRAGWHVNANPASEESLIPTSLSSARSPVRAVRYPEGERLGPGPDAAAVYRGTVRLSGEIDVSGGDPVIQLTYQACDDTRCLAPVPEEVALKHTGPRAPRVRAHRPPLGPGSRRFDVGPRLRPASRLERSSSDRRARHNGVRGSAELHASTR